MEIHHGHRNKINIIPSQQYHISLGVKVRTSCQQAAGGTSHRQYSRHYSKLKQLYILFKKSIVYRFKIVTGSSGANYNSEFRAGQLWLAGLGWPGWPSWHKNVKKMLCCCMCALVEFIELLLALCTYKYI